MMLRSINFSNFSPTSTDTNSLSCEDSWPSISLNTKKFNFTESIKVPTSDHVAEIVGRQGTKIKELRMRTGTYIKTPVKDEDPVFIITGRKENIEMAKREILSIADKFTRMRSSKLYSGGMVHSTLFEIVKIELSVPYNMVGLVVGPKGSTIIHIQEATQTFIKTPNRDQKPVFKISGLPENVLKAKDEIQSHVLVRTGKILPESSWKLCSQEGGSEGEEGRTLCQRVYCEDFVAEEFDKHFFDAPPGESKDRCGSFDTSQDIFPFLLRPILDSSSWQ